MRHVLLILSFLLSCLFSDGKAGDACKLESTSTAILAATEQERPDTNPDYNAPAILPAQSTGISVENTNFTPSVKSTNTGRRTQVSQKSPFRIVKAGKVIDRHVFYDFLSELHQFQSGIYSTSRYIHTICQLLI